MLHYLSIIESTNQSHDCFPSQRELSPSHSSGSSSIILFTSERTQDNHIFMQNVSTPSSAEPLATNECGHWHLGHHKEPKSSVPPFKMALERQKQMFFIYFKIGNVRESGRRVGSVEDWKWMEGVSGRWLLLLVFIGMYCANVWSHKCNF